MVKDHSDSERGNPLPPYGLLFRISSKGSFKCTIPQTEYHIPRALLQGSNRQDKLTVVKPVVDHWLYRINIIHMAASSLPLAYIFYLVKS